MSQLYYKTLHKIKSPDSNWTRVYLTDRTQRITYILRNELKNDFWDNYSKVFLLFVEKNKLLFRAKIIDSEFVIFFQIWGSKEDADLFEKTANISKKPLDLLSQRGYLVECNNAYITHDVANKLVQEINKSSGILQIVNKIFFTPGMIVGDPVKKNSGHLPFPENK